MTERIHELSIASLGAAYREGRLSPVFVTEAMLERIRTIDPALGSYAHVATDLALAAAHRAEDELARGLDRGPLHGVPLAMKDIFFNDAMPTSVGLSRVPEHWERGPATVFERTVRAGAVVLGALVTTEGVFSDYLPGRGAPVNPWGPQLWSGASSSGPGAATAARLCFGAFASDTGGSIRFPSAAASVTGLKPTWGRVSRYGAAPLAPSLDHIGPIARTADDALLMLRAVEGYDRNDPTSSRRRPSAARGGVTVAGLRVGIDRASLAGLPDEVLSAVESVIRVLVDAGALLTPIRLPDPGPVVRAWDVIASTEAYTAHQEQFDGGEAEYGPVFAGLLEQGRGRSAGEYAQANLARTAYRLALEDVFRDVDLFITPALWDLLPTVTRWRESHADSETVTRFASPLNVAGTPSLTLPAGFDSRGAPIGVQLCGAPFAETMLADVGSAVQAVSEWHLASPDLADLSRPDSMRAGDEDDA